MSPQGMVAADGQLVLLNGKSGVQLTDLQEMREDRLPANRVFAGVAAPSPATRRVPRIRLSLERAVKAARVVAGRVLDARLAT